MTWAEFGGCRTAYYPSADGVGFVGELGGWGELLVRWETEVGKWGERWVAIIAFPFPFGFCSVPDCRDGACPVSG